ncbi:MraZ protein [Tistlia consotensis]|uniref:Transcriptional regulator MraZ n=1 Tax=Tistlia consotensis USBA 355 TaxID=560819 RepID=A0A1Y6CRJ6_9PROT|nr:division/cell wall cluster transcriptional repressor MraZ [Tistlia consotensis]SMF70991.1 MraZ protein [Tistlia consotensis USBA 355]SNS07135.1 MraZ protein [Tistlia consotensis]
MRQPFLGTHINKIDAKGRVSVPAAFRQVLAEDAFKGVVCFPSYKVDAIEGCAMAFMTELVSSVDDYELFSDEQQALSDVIFGTSSELAWDANGRIQLPPDLLEMAGIADTAAFVGMGKTFRIWQPEALARNQAERRAQARDKGLSLRLPGARPRSDA